MRLKGAQIILGELVIQWVKWRGNARKRPP